MIHEGQMQSNYTVNGEIIFDKSKKELQGIFDDFHNNFLIVNLVLEVKGFYLS